jgi:hypothetical protein
MIVSIDDFNMGAMENKGLNVFNSRLVLADEKSATDHDFEMIESVVGHEYFHNWTGNRVTCRNWFELSLKEGLTVFRDQEFSADMNSRPVQRIKDVDSLRSRQFTEDAGPNAHPVRPESCLAVDNFYTATIYEKGAEVIRMMQTIVGRDGFRKGMDEYFKRHDGQAVTIIDFAEAIAAPNKADFSQFKRWYSQAGTPVVTVTENYDQATGTLTLTLAQSSELTVTEKQEKKEKLPFHIPLYGSHISLFPILAAIAIFFYMKMTSGDQQMAAPQQEGMPDMAKMMKIMIYVSPLMMLFFFNSYGAGLSLYNFISNLVTILIMLVIKRYFIDGDKIHAQIQENKLKEPKKQGRFQRKLQEAMEQAEAQKAAQQKKK